MSQRIIIVILIAGLSATTLAQSSGGSFQVTSSVVAGGGEQSTGSGNLVINGTAGEPGAGTLLRQAPFSQTGGFWPGTLANTPTAAPASISGRITTVDGAPLAGVVMTLSGARQRRAITDSNGVYSFSDVEIGGFFSLLPSLANYTFAPPDRSFSLLANKTDAVFTALADAVPTANPLDTPEYFVRQQYLDMLGREPDESGFNYWSDQILACVGDAACTRAVRTSVAAAFFIEQEAQLTGSFIYDIYQVALRRRPVFAEYATDHQLVIAGANLNAEKQGFAISFVQRAEFQARYQSAITPETFVDALLQGAQSSGVDLSGERGNLISAYYSGGSTIESRALVVRAVADNPTFKQSQYNAAFVLTEYFSYLRRDAEPDGFNFWLNVLNNGAANNYRGMVCSFITSAEYQRRFSPVVSRTNADCGQ